jgi:hypothetical protein
MQRGKGEPKDRLKWLKFIFFHFPPFCSKVDNEVQRKGNLMPLTFSEADLKVIDKIQQDRGCTREHAKAVYRKYVNKLANPDIENRAELVLGAVTRGVKAASDDEVEAAVTINPGRTKKAATVPKAKKTLSESKRIEWPLAKLEREIELTPTDTNHIYTANLFGRKHATVWAELDHAEQGTKSRFGPVDISARRLEALKEFARINTLPIAICVTVRVGGRLDQGYAVPFALYDAFKKGAKNAFTVSGLARKAYSEGGWDGVKFSEKAVTEKAA